MKYRHQHLGSLVHQVEQALQAVLKPGTSRHAAKQAGTAGSTIVSFGSLRSYLDTCIPFARWCQGEYGTCDIALNTPAMAESYIRHLHSDGYSLGHIGKVMCGLRHLDHGLRVLGRVALDAPPLLAQATGRHSDPRPTPLLSAEADQVIADLLGQVDPVYGELAQLQRAAGLRLSEAVNLRAAAIAADGAHIALARNDYAKGGRRRTIPIEPQHRAFLVRLRERGLARRNGHVFDGRAGLARTYQRKFAKACQRCGIAHSRTHDLRATFAEEVLAALIAQGMPLDEARLELSHRLGHGRVEVLRSYVGSDGNHGFDTEDSNDA